MAGYCTIYCIGGLGGFEGADGINPIQMQIWVGISNRLWLAAFAVGPEVLQLFNGTISSRTARASVVRGLRTLTVNANGGTELAAVFGSRPDGTSMEKPAKRCFRITNIPFAAGGKDKE